MRHALIETLFQFDTIANKTSAQLWHSLPTAERKYVCIQNSLFVFHSNSIDSECIFYYYSLFPQVFTKRSQSPLYRFWLLVHGFLPSGNIKYYLRHK